MTAGQEHCGYMECVAGRSQNLSRCVSRIMLHHNKCILSDKWEGDAVWTIRKCQAQGHDPACSTTGTKNSFTTDATAHCEGGGVERRRSARRLVMGAMHG